jgi:hypothetical protein
MAGSPGRQDRRMRVDRMVGKPPKKKEITENAEIEIELHRGAPFFFAKAKNFSRRKFFCRIEALHKKNFPRGLS